MLSSKESSLTGIELASLCLLHCRRILYPLIHLGKPVFVPGESHGQRSLKSYSPEGRKELDITEVTPHARKIKMGLFTLAKLNLQKSRKNPAYKPYCKVL